jgi:hypothetical protein
MLNAAAISSAALNGFRASAANACMSRTIFCVASFIPNGSPVKNVMGMTSLIIYYVDLDMADAPLKL